MANELEVSVQLDAGALERGGQAMRDLLEKVVAKSAFDVQAKAQNLMTEKKIIDTGATRASIYVNIAGRSSTYSQAAAAARTARPGVQLTPADTVTGDDGLAARIGPSTSYAPILEFGGHSRPARPFMVPALEAIRPGFEQAIKDATEEAFRG